MKRLAWITDPHLNFLEEDEAELFSASLAREEADAFVITGDIGEAPNVALYLHGLDRHLDRPIYFVLGNHDFYGSSIAAVRRMIQAFTAECPNLHWLPLSGIVPLTEKACLIGHDGWADGRLGDYWGSTIQLNDWRLIAEFAGMDPMARLKKLTLLGDEAAAQLRGLLPEALERFSHVLVATHVPPFRESCWHEGRVSSDAWLPHMTCKAIGDVLAELMTAHPDRHMTVLCGHSHGQGEALVLPNLRVLTGGAIYGAPKLQKILVIE
jgi:3',5'-cyclic-AMP phosphodiesterase